MDPVVPNVSSLQSEPGANLLDAIDSLRSHGISRFVSLPQIIVVGDQSSGKSSVLEAITGVAFPTGDGVCTRFATEVILRRSREEKASVRIRPSAECDAGRRVKLKDFHQTRISLAQASDLIAEATKVMGIEENVQFSEDVLELEISGPQQPHLTLVDLPGIFHTATFKQKKEDPAVVTKIVRRYMEEKRSIILAAISGKYDYAVQKILGMLTLVDSEGTRTMGVITKPDAIEQDSADEQTFLSLARNVERPLKLGWHVLRNPSFTERRDPGFDRDKTEALFFTNQVPWNTLSSNSVGVVTLRRRLSRLLFDHITSELPGLVDNIELETTKCRSILDTLGPERTETRDQRVYLTDIAERFRRLADDGVKGYYEDGYFEQAPENRLRAQVQKENEDFGMKMSTEGHRWTILPNAPIFVGHWGTAGLVLPAEGAATTIQRNNYIRKACDLLDDYRGRELRGHYNPFRVRELFKRQSVSWQRLAREYTHKVLDRVTVFVEDLTEHVAGWERAEVLLKHLIDPAIAEMQDRLEAKVAELLTPYTEGFPLTLNQEYNAALAKLDEEENANSERGEDDRQRINRIACSKLVDCMESYYKIALGVFMDNVAILAIENCVLNNVSGLISPVTVAKMSSEETKLLASEFPEDARIREETMAKMDVLQKGLRTCQQYAQRKPAQPKRAQSEQSRRPSATSTSAGATSLFPPSPSRPVTPGLTPTSTAERSSITSGSRSEPTIPAIPHSHTPVFTYSLPNPTPNPFTAAQPGGQVSSPQKM